MDEVPYQLIVQSALSERKRMKIIDWVDDGEMDIVLCHRDRILYIAGTMSDPDDILKADPEDWTAEDDCPPQQVNLSRIYPGYSPLCFTKATNCSSPDVYIKSPRLLQYARILGIEDIFGPRQRELTLREARVGEEIRKNPHPNLAVYYGVQVDTKVRIKSFKSKPFSHGHIIGLCFKKYSCTLDDLVEQRKYFDADACLASIKAGLRHLHSLGYVHCDIKPDNIFYSSENGGHFVVGDFDSCIEIGNCSQWKCGTRGWSPTSVSYAKPRIDFGALEKIRLWLETKGFRHLEGSVAYPSAGDILLNPRLKYGSSESELTPSDVLDQKFLKRDIC